jgi:hypothetical protein
VEGNGPTLRGNGFTSRGNGFTSRGNGPFPLALALALALLFPLGTCPFPLGTRIKREQTFMEDRRENSTPLELGSPS